jgi:hypothetical protein
MLTTRNPETGIDSHHSLASTETAEFLNYRHYVATGKPLSETSLKGVTGLLAAKAKYEGTCHPIYSRIAHHDGEIYVDLGDDQQRAVRISPALLPIGFAVVSSDEVPVRFRRSRSALALPIPVPGGSIEPLWAIFPNVTTEDRILALGWLIGCFQQHGGRNFLEVLGGQGSGKSTFARLLIALIDPNMAPMRAMPKNEQDLLISVSHRVVAGMDNLSVVLPEMADAFCRISTGAGISSRTLFSNAEETLLIAQLVLMWTAIEPQALRRPDLQDRTTTIRLDPIETDGVVSERELLEVFEEIRPELLGALYSAVAVALDRIDQVVIERLPRLADFAVWVEAAAPAFGWDEGQFLDALEASRATASALAVDASPIGTLILKFMEDRSSWAGTSSELLEELKRLSDDDQRRSRSFPKDAIRLSGQLRRMVQPLNSLGVWVGFDRSNRSRGITLDRHEHLSKPPPRPVAPVQATLEPERTCARCGGTLTPDRQYLCTKCMETD